MMDAFSRVAQISDHAGFYALTLQSLDENSTAFYESLNFKNFRKYPEPKNALPDLQYIISSARCRSTDGHPAAKNSGTGLTHRSTSRPQGAHRRHPRVVKGAFKLTTPVLATKVYAPGLVPKQAPTSFPLDAGFPRCPHPCPVRAVCGHCVLRPDLAVHGYLLAPRCVRRSRRRQ